MRVANAGQREEEPAADGRDVLLQRLAVQPVLQGQEPGVEVTLEALEEQALVEVAGGVEAEGVGEAAAVAASRAAGSTVSACSPPPSPVTVSAARMSDARPQITS